MVRIKFEDQRHQITEVDCFLTRVRVVSRAEGISYLTVSCEICAAGADLTLENCMAMADKVGRQARGSI